MGGCQFDYDQQSLFALVSRCSSGNQEEGLVCSGLPPESCSAFGAKGHWRQVSTENPTKCTSCLPPAVARGIAAGCAAATCLCLALVAAFVAPHRTALRGWLSTVTIALGHTQSLSLIGRLNFCWPSSIRAFFDVLDISTIDLSCSVKVECLVPSSLVDGSRRALLYSIVMSSLLLLLLHRCTIGKLLADSSWYMGDGSPTRPPPRGWACARAEHHFRDAAQPERQACAFSASQRRREEQRLQPTIVHGCGIVRVRLWVLCPSFGHFSIRVPNYRHPAQLGATETARPLRHREQTLPDYASQVALFCGTPSGIEPRPQGTHFKSRSAH
eukprot:7390975-Prymnesium_polylepis.3